MEWAEKIVDAKIKRGEIKVEDRQQWIEHHVQNVENILKDNIERAGRWGKSTSKQGEIEERERLIGLKQQEEARSQLEWEWAQKGVKVSVGFHPPHKIQYVTLNFTPAQWGDILNKEGEILPQCCATISAIRNALQDALRENGEISIQEFEALVINIRSHGLELGDENPLYSILGIWDLIKEDMDETLNINRLYEPVSFDDPKDAIKALCHAASVIECSSLFEKRTGITEFQELAHRENELSLLMAAVHCLYHKGLDLSNGDIIGYGLFLNDEILATYSGLAIYKSPEELKRVNKRINFDKEKEYSIKKVKISARKGLEIL